MAQAKKAIAKKQRTNSETRTRANTYLNYIGGRWAPSTSGESSENRNPADTRDLVGRFPVSTTEDVDAAVAAARDAFDAWRLTPAPKRAELMLRVGEILMRDKQQYTADTTREVGTVLT